MDGAILFANLLYKSWSRAISWNCSSSAGEKLILARPAPSSSNYNPEISSLVNKGWVGAILPEFPRHEGRFTEGRSRLLCGSVHDRRYANYRHSCAWWCFIHEITICNNSDISWHFSCGYHLRAFLYFQRLLIHIFTSIRNDHVRVFWAWFRAHGLLLTALFQIPVTNTRDVDATKSSNWYTLHISAISTFQRRQSALCAYSSGTDHNSRNLKTFDNKKKWPVFSTCGDTLINRLISWVWTWRNADGTWSLLRITWMSGTWACVDVFWLLSWLRDALELTSEVCIRRICFNVCFAATSSENKCSFGFWSSKSCSIES